MRDWCACFRKMLTVIGIIGKTHGRHERDQPPHRGGEQKRSQPGLLRVLGLRVDIRQVEALRDRVELLLVFLGRNGLLLVRISRGFLAGLLDLSRGNARSAPVRRRTGRKRWRWVQ